MKSIFEYVSIPRLSTYKTNYVLWMLTFFLPHFSSLFFFLQIYCLSRDIRIVACRLIMSPSHLQGRHTTSRSDIATTRSDIATMRYDTRQCKSTSRYISCFYRRHFKVDMATLSFEIVAVVCDCRVSLRNIAMSFRVVVCRLCKGDGDIINGPNRIPYILIFNSFQQNWWILSK
jgi:hypothetical protein